MIPDGRASAIAPHACANAAIRSHFLLAQQPELARRTESEPEARGALITGATSGIGFSTAVELAHRQVRVLLHGRTAMSAQKAVERVRAQVPLARVEAVWADLGVMAEVRALAERVLEEPRLDVLVHNAGLERWVRASTPDGFELTFAVNHMAPFLLTRLLVPLLVCSKPSRIIIISSVVHGWGRMHWDDLQAREWYSPEPVYYQSKLAVALASQEFARRLWPLGVSVLLVPPGLTHTSFARDFQGLAGWWTRVIGGRLFRAPEAVAREVAEVSLSPTFASVAGAYLDRLEIGVPAPRARVRADQLRLWKLTSELLGLPADEPLRRVELLPALSLTRPKLGRWLRAVTSGELLGFTSTALIAFVALTLGGHPTTIPGRVAALLIMVVAGTLEGASLGFFQWRALRRWLPDLPAPRFVGATIAVAAGGWLIGMSVPLVMTLTGAMASPASTSAAIEPSLLRVTLFGMGFGAIVGALFGAAQARVLAAHVRGVSSWILGNAFGWALGLPLAYIAGSLGSRNMAWWQAFGLSAAAGAGMGLCVAVGTFVATRWMQPKLATGNVRCFAPRPAAGATSLEDRS